MGVLDGLIGVLAGWVGGRRVRKHVACSRGCVWAWLRRACLPALLTDLPSPPLLFPPPPRCFPALQEYFTAILKKLKEVGASSKQTNFYV